MNLLLEKIYLNKMEFVTSGLLKEYCRSLKLEYTQTIKNLLFAGYLIRIFRGIFYVRTLEEKKLGKSKYSAYDFVAKGLELKHVNAWYFGLTTAIALNHLTHERFTLDYVLNDTFFRPRPLTIEGHKFRFIKMKPALLSIGIKKHGNLRYSDTEKTILDLIYLRRQNGIPDERIILEISDWVKGISEKKIKKYLALYPKTIKAAFRKMKP